MTDLTYDEFINNILQSRGRFSCGDEYHERHHIIPRCLGGTDSKENLIDLFAREHFEAHRLLALENPNNESLVYAWSCMAFVKNKNQERYEVSPHEYEEARIALSEFRKNKHHSEEARQRMSISQQERLANPEDNPMYGKHHTEKTKEKIKKAKEGKYKGENNPLYGKARSAEIKIKISESRTKDSIVQLGMNGDFIAEYGSAYKAFLTTGVSNLNILNCCYGGCKSAGGFIWLFKDDYDATTIYEYKDNGKRPVVQLDLFGNFVSEYVSVSEASRKIGGYNGCIYKACLSKSHIAYGFLWMFKEDYDSFNEYKYVNNSGIPVVCLDIDENYVCEYKSATEAYNVTGINNSSIIKCCKGKQKTSGGFKWMYRYEWEAKNKGETTKMWLESEDDDGIQD